MPVLLFKATWVPHHHITHHDYYNSLGRDLVHRQTACWAVKHMALGVYGFGCEDALIHLMNCVWPNIFETAPHMMQSFHDATDGMRVSIGPVRVLLYTLQVREYSNEEGYICVCVCV